MSAAHTPGPWVFLEDGRSEEAPNAGRPLTICGPDADDLANVYSYDDATVNITRAEAVANARLIAAAPLLLEALVKIANTLDEGWREGSMERRLGDLARAAIAAARGTP